MDARLTAKGAPAVAIFDLNRTLVPGSSLLPLARQLARRGVIERSRLFGAVARNAAFAFSGADSTSAERLTAEALAAVAGAPADVMRDAVVVAAEEIVRSFRPAMRTLAHRHAAQGDVCIIVSAAPHELVHEVATMGGFELGVGTRVEVRDGMLTGRLDGPFCHGAGKLARLRDELRDVDLARATAYSDAGSDLPLLQACGAPVAVRPDRVLRAAARRAGWPVLSG